MRIKINDFIQPEFLLAEIPIKEDSWHDDRLWVVHLPSGSVLEFVESSNLVTSSFDEDKIAGNFQYEFEHYQVLWVKNQTMANGFIDKDVYLGAVEFFTDYLHWEDGNLDQRETTLLN